MRPASFAPRHPAKRPSALPGLVCAAHGTRDDAGVAAIKALVTAVRHRLPASQARVGFIELAKPGIEEAISEGGPGCVVVPLLLSRGYHLEKDLRVAAARAGATLCPPLGPHALLAAALTRLLAASGAPAGTPVVLAAAGSSDPLAAMDVAEMAALLAARIGTRVLAASVAGLGERPADALGRLEAETGMRPALAQYLLAPGQFSATLERCGAAWSTAPLAAEPEVASLVILRYRQALDDRHPKPAGRRLPGSPLSLSPRATNRPTQV